MKWIVKLLIWLGLKKPSAPPAVTIKAGPPPTDPKRVRALSEPIEAGPPPTDPPKDGSGDQ